MADLEPDTSGRRARRGTREIGFTAREYDLLEFMARNHCRVLWCELLLTRGWQQKFGFAPNAVDVYVGYLRRKVDGPGETPLIQTVHGVGYVLREDWVLAAGGLMAFLLSVSGVHLLAHVAPAPRGGACGARDHGVGPLAAASRRPLDGWDLAPRHHQ